MEKTTKDKVEERDGAVASARDGRRPGGQAAGEGGGMEMGGMGMGGMGMGGGGGAMSFRGLRTFSSFKNPVFRLYFGAVGGQFASMQMQQLARSLLIYRITGSASVLGLLTLANSLPMLFFSLFGGVLADRVQKKYVLLGGMVGSAILAFAVAFLLAAEVLSEKRSDTWWILLVYALVQGTIQGLSMPSRQAIIRDIVGEEQLMNAVALSNLEMNINRLFMPAAAGFLIAAFGFVPGYLFMGVMYTLSILFILLMPITGTISIKGRGALADVKDGLLYIRNENTLLLLLAVTFFTVLCSTPYMTLLPVFTESILNVGAEGMGVLISISGIGALAASLVLASLPNKRRGLMLIVGGLILGVSLVGFSFSSVWVFSLIAIVFVGLGQAVRMTLANTLLQYYVADEYRGRVMSLYMMEFGLTSIGVFIASIAADQIGVQWSVGGLAIALVVASIAFLIFLPKLRKLD